MEEIVFLIEEVQEGGYTAKALDETICTKADSIFELNKMIRNAVASHFDQENLPKIKLTFSKN